MFQLPNRKTRRAMLNSRQRGIGHTRQYSSARARRKHGTVCLGQVSDLSTLNDHWKDRVGYVDPSDTLDFAGHATDPELIEEATDPVNDPSQVQIESLLSHSAKTVVAELKTGEYDSVLSEVRAAEVSGKARKTVLNAIDAR